MSTQRYSPFTETEIEGKILDNTFGRIGSKSENKRRYPEMEETITVMGTFDTYEEDGMIYPTLREAELIG